MNYMNLFFTPNTSDNYIMNLCMIDPYKNLRCNNIKMKIENPSLSNRICFPIKINFDIMFCIRNITCLHYIKKIELCYMDTMAKIIDIKLDKDFWLPLYLYMFYPLCLMIEYDSNSPPLIEINYDAGLLQSSFRKHEGIIFPKEVMPKI